MSAPPSQKPVVSLRGASAREISRDELLERVAAERERRNFLRRASAAALLIQRVWRRYDAVKAASKRLQEEWEALVAGQHDCRRNLWISYKVLRPFLFFVNQPYNLYKTERAKAVGYMSTCFRILLSSIGSSDSDQNFCSLAVGTVDERSTWSAQAKKLIMLCSYIISECDYSCGCDDVVSLSGLAIRLVFSLTDAKAWRSLKSDSSGDVDVAVQRLIGFTSSRESGFYFCFRSYLRNLYRFILTGSKSDGLKDDHFLITASTITIALRPFHYQGADNNILDLSRACKEYLICILTIPYLCKCIPSMLLTAVKHESVLQPCLNTLVIFKDEIFDEIAKFQQSEKSKFGTMEIPYSCWLLGNFITLVTGYEENSSHSKCFMKGIDCHLYIDVVSSISQNILHIDGSLTKLRCNFDAGNVPSFTLEADPSTLFLELLKPIHQHWHLRKLLTLAKEEACNDSKEGLGMQNSKQVDVMCFYYYMVRIFTVMKGSVGPSPVLNLLSFNPGFLEELWKTLDYCLFGESTQRSEGIRTEQCNQFTTGSSNDQLVDTKQRRNTKDVANKWVNVLQRMTKKSSETDYTVLGADNILNHEIPIEELILWDIEAMRRGPQGLPDHVLCMLHLFCATYGQLLLVMDDIEFYEQQVPFTLEQQQKIASVLNTFVYNCYTEAGGQDDQPLTGVAVKCLHLLYERDSRHRFCPASLWLAPARNCRVPIAAAARAHEAAYGNRQASESSAVPIRSTVLTAIPHVYPFEERVKMFRELIEMDKAARRATGEVSGPGPGSVEIVVRRGHIVEDGFKQLKYLGPKLKSHIHVSFVSECGLPEAGLDYGGLTKEFLTDMCNAAFSPEYGLFAQTLTSESSLVPNISAKYLDTGLEMFEFLGQVVGKALYEGILLDYSFSLVFVQKLLGRYSFLDELSALDSELYRSLMQLKHFDGNVEDLCLDFSATEEICGKIVTTELRTGGKSIAVTNENKLQYVHEMADYKLNRQMLPFANSFCRGLSDLISPSWLCLFNANEFNLLVSGGRQDFDVDDLRSNTKYTGGYTESSRTVKFFWEVVKGFKPAERCLLLKFVTSCSRAPILGFKHLHPSFTIHKVPCDAPILAILGGQDVDRLPSASTCYNTLKLPTYKRSSTLRSKLLYAICSNTGFELS